MPHHVVTVLVVGQVRSTLDSDLQRLDLYKKCFIDDLNSFNYRQYCIDTFGVYLQNDNVSKFGITTSTLSQNVKIENTITEYVKKHMYDLLQDNNYNLFLSGGIDSENIANILIECGINFTPVIVSYKHKNKVLNDYDISYAYKFCTENNITPKIIDIDIIEFFSKGTFRKYAFDYGCISPQFAPILHAFEKIDGNILYSGHQKIFTNLFYNCRAKNKSLHDVVEEYDFNGDYKNDVNFMEKTESLFVFDRVLKERNDNSIYDFYNFNTDMCLTSTNNLLQNTNISYENLLEYNSWKIDKDKITWAQDWKDSQYGVTNKRQFKHRRLKANKYKFKYDNLYVPNNLLAKPRPKYTGFEGVKKFYSDKYIGKDLLLKQFDKYFRETLTHAVDTTLNTPGMVVNYILREK